MTLPAIEPEPLSVNVCGLSVAGSIALLKVALMAALGGTIAIPLPGVVRVIVGAVVSRPEPVVKVQLNAAANGLPARSLVPVLIVAVNKTPAARGLLGVNFALAPTAE